MDVHVLVGHERRIGRKNAVPGGQFDQFLYEFVVFALQVQLVEDFAHAADGPKFFDECEALIAALIRECGGKIELLLFLADSALNDDLGRPGLLVSADQHQLLAGKQIHVVLRIDRD